MDRCFLLCHCHVDIFAYRYVVRVLQSNTDVKILANKGNRNH